MKKGLTEVVFILDRSGSMGGLEQDTIGGFNSMLAKQRKETKDAGEVIISTVLFDDHISVLHDRKNIREVNDLTDKDYYVGGCTALLDAIGKTVKYIGKVQKEMPEHERPEKTMFIITTDGEENSSKEYTFDKIKKMIEKKQNKKSWEFLFLGANIDAIGTASSLGIRKDRALNYKCDSQGTAINYSVLSNTLSAVRRSKSKEQLDNAVMACCMPIAEDYAKRNQ